MGIIYKIVNRVNAKIYIGRDKHNNPKYMGSGKLLQLAFKKYGIENFYKETIEECDNDNLDAREKFWIKELKSQDHLIGYNIADGGHNDFTMNDYVKSKISSTLKGKRKSEEHRKQFQNLKKVCHSQINKKQEFQREC